MNVNSRTRPNAWRAGICALIGLVVITLAIASTLHFGVRLLGVEDALPGAALPEAIIAGVLLVGGAIIASGLPHAWGWGLGATILATVGFLVGLRFEPRREHELLHLLLQLPRLVPRRSYAGHR